MSELNRSELPEPSAPAVQQGEPSCDPPSRKSSRRQFIKTGSAVTAGLTGAAALQRPVRGAEPSEGKPELVRIGIVGLGGRGTGALTDTLTINDNVQLVATADVDPYKQQILKRLEKFGEKVSVAPGKNYLGIDSYKQVLDDPDVDLVIMTTPPGFRPQYVMDAVDAGKHVFAEKPSCVDPAGYRLCLQAHEKAKANGTAIVTGTQYRRQTNYVEAVRQIHEGVIGDVINMTARYCSNGIWYRPRKEGMSDTQYQVHNWMHFIWLSGDQIAEQAVHNIDLMNWVMQDAPVSAYGSGGRFTRPEDSEMWDNVSVDYTYPGSRQVSFMCRQIPGTAGDNSNHIYGSKGTATIYGSNRGASIVDRAGKEIWSMKGDISAAYKQEHKDLVDSIRAGDPIVELKETADSSMTAILGRAAAYTGQNVTWDFMVNESKQALFPADFDINGPRPESHHAVPGETKLV
ncbi:Gfo/Idh/MocA family oxidoreductase [Stieleria sp. TO1_6]|uniref:Gfo/Idh/MocA family protein n=1 Tax=Stieleria tagensis TaxID=2956795 RepID=UPI00209B1544|nr:Gfo/Idh/MocA family oxidoreductase [Stieleria tagensis]MCO8125109.1 Gfo/Idh/MocA family oxidoreductase [Stieleria tagensis]